MIGILLWPVIKSRFCQVRKQTRRSILVAASRSLHAPWTLWQPDFRYWGTVHPQSATAHYLKGLGTGTYLSMASSEDLASALLALSDSRTWESASRESLTGFRRNREEKNSFVSWMAGDLSSRPTS